MSRTRTARSSVRPASLTPLLGLTLLLAGCGQGTQTNAAHPVAGPVAGTADQHAQPGTYQTQKAARPAQTPEAGTPDPTTYLSATLPRPGLSAQSVNKDIPVVLVHGLGGFGRDEFLGHHYWGGLYDTQERLRAEGYQVYSASIGPISSNWDRAAELYAQIKGGCVDYGAAHSTAAGHTRSDPAKCYPGFYPAWDAQHPVNLIGHSMGGPTTLMLLNLLEDGSPADADGQNLYAGGRMGWVRSAMTVSGANSGSPAADNLLNTIPFLKDLLLSFAGAAGVTGNVGASVYNFDLGQWGITRQPGDTFKTYTERAFDPNNALWRTNDQAGYDLRVEGAAAMNRRIGGLPRGTRLFSWATADTYAGLLTGWQYPNVTMNPVMNITAYPYAWPLPPGLGNMTGKSALGTVTYDQTWWKNDGLVPMKVQHAPLGQPSEAYAAQPTRPGHWYTLGTLNGSDHIDIIGLFGLKDVTPFFRNQVTFLNSQ